LRSEFKNAFSLEILQQLGSALGLWLIHSP